MKYAPTLFAALFALALASSCDSNAAGGGAMTTLARSSGTPIHLGDSTLRVPLSNASAGGLRTLAPGRKAVLILDGLKAAQQPGITYRVYFGLPSGAAPDDAHLVGTINFYSAVPLAGAKPKPDPVLEFDVTALAGESGDFAVTLVPEGKTEANSAPEIKEITIVAR